MRTATSSLSPVLSVLTLALAALAGCDDPADPGAADVIALRTGGGYGCTLCTLNSATINDSLVTELNLDGAPNASGVRLLNIKNPQTGATFRPDYDVLRDELIARNAQNQIALAGPQLVGKVLSLETPDGPLSLNITAYDNTVPSWSATGGPTTIYRLQWKGADNVWRAICPNTSDPNKDMVTLIYGETYDRVTNDIVGGMGRWFTIACVAEVAFKMKMMDYHPAGRRKANLEQRQTTMRMISADYCGDGTPYTIDGTTVAWRNRDSSVYAGVAENSLEAKWGPDGALCLDDPRYADPGSVHCSIPSCGGDATFTAGLEWRTMLP